MTTPFDDIRSLLATLPGPDDAAAAAARRRRLAAGPDGSLGHLEDAIAWLCAWQGSPRPRTDRALVCVFAASHGVAGAGPELRHRLDLFATGRAAINAVCAAQGLGFKAFDLALDLPSGDIATEPALTERECVATMAFGMEAVAGGVDLLALGEASPAARIAAGAVAAALCDGAEPWTGPADGPEERALVERALARHGGSADPLEILASLGGRDLAAIAGAIVAARHQRVPVVLDGFAATAAAAVLAALDPRLTGHCLAGHASDDPAHARLLKRLGLTPLLDGLALPDGSAVGAALALGLLRTAAAVDRERPDRD